MYDKDGALAVSFAGSFVPEDSQLAVLRIQTYYSAHLCYFLIRVSEGGDVRFPNFGEFGKAVLMETYTKLTLRIT